MTAPPPPQDLEKANRRVLRFLGAALLFVPCMVGAVAFGQILAPDVLDNEPIAFGAGHLAETPLVVAICLCIALALSALWQRRRDPDLRQWFLYAPTSGLVVLVATLLSVTLERRNAIDDPTQMHIAARIEHLGSDPISGPANKPAIRHKGRVAHLRYYAVIRNPWRRGEMLELPWKKIALPRSYEWTDYARDAARIGAAQAPTWRGQCLYAVAGLGKSDRPWISKDRRIAPCP